MSKENLNPNNEESLGVNNEVNPLEEKSDKIKFTVDEMGLSTPGKVVPTDVDYFIRKQQGKLEPNYTFKEALGKAFDIDNLFISGINKFENAFVVYPDMNIRKISTNHKKLIKLYKSGIKKGIEVLNKLEIDTKKINI